MAGVGLDACCHCANVGARLKDQFSSSDVFFKDLKSLKKECEEALVLDPAFRHAQQRELQAVERHLDMCAEARKVVDWKSDLKESDAAFIEGANASSFVMASKCEA
ncbi:inactive TPR repeat-containing thioredoxin TTL3-like isoform X2 [Zingiber officinale]|uniref:inactive TPR repeat-containing thioredoxin TTL3-like isoform X2 n=1 Tax=Zingiber officinale TaxID=94328 RepID=UPI001C4B9B35|nr:inactive TPR repeat-containing thioredoxin TTL3-like isoform X2 [Zingiber officinale]